MSEGTGSNCCVPGVRLLETTEPEYCLASAAAQGVQRAHYSLKSNLKTLETFKESLGFEPYPFPAWLHVRRPVAPLLRAFRPRAYKRLFGNDDWAGHPEYESSRRLSVEPRLTQAIATHFRSREAWYMASITLTRAAASRGVTSGRSLPALPSPSSGPF